jgi:hypothetical protein
MHLIQGISTLNTRKPQFKLTKTKEASWREDLAVYNREMRRQGQSKLTWEQYVAMRLGKTAKPVAIKNTYVPKYSHPRYTDRQQIASLETDVGNTNLRESIKYTGTLVKGIVVQHKSCLQPIISKDEAIDSARMRR